MSINDKLGDGELTEATIAIINKLIGDNILNVLKDFEYKAKDAPAVRRKAMAASKLTHDEVMKFWAIMLLRGGNKKRLLAGTDQSMMDEIKMIMTRMKVKNTAIVNKDGIWSTWQVMSSFFDYGVLMVVKSKELEKKLFFFADQLGRTFTINIPGLPSYMVVPGAFHLLQGLDPDIIDNVIRAVLLYQNLVIYVKGVLAGKKTESIITQMKLEKNAKTRMNQYSFNKLATTPSEVNFNPKAIKDLCTSIGLAVDQLKVPKLSDWDFAADPLPDKFIDSFLSRNKT
jgi:uncharacterized protein YeeX (DUF496 family)